MQIKIYSDNGSLLYDMNYDAMQECWADFDPTTEDGNTTLSGFSYIPYVHQIDKEEVCVVKTKGDKK